MRPVAVVVGVVVVVVALSVVVAPARAQDDNDDDGAPHVPERFIDWGVRDPSGLADGVRGYHGFRYARPPSRFLPPDVRGDFAPRRDHPGDVLPSACEILGPRRGPNAAFFADVFNTTMSEDCLFVDVYVPPQVHTRANDDAAADAETPMTIVYIHGGFHITGHHLYTPLQQLARATGAIVVGVQARLGVFGFFAPPPATPLEENGFMLNHGIQDQSAALAWTSRYVRTFGGDANKVVLAGHSAGSMAVLAHMQYEASWPYFQHAIVMSPGPADVRTREEASAVSINLLAQIGCLDSNMESTFECVLSMSADEMSERISAYLVRDAIPFDQLALPLMFADGRVVRDSMLRTFGHAATNERAAAGKDVRMNPNLRSVIITDADSEGDSLTNGPITAFGLPPFFAPEAVYDQLVQLYVSTFNGAADAQLRPSHIGEVYAARWVNASEPLQSRNYFVAASELAGQSGIQCAVVTLSEQISRAAQLIEEGSDGERRFFVGRYHLTHDHFVPHANLTVDPTHTDWPELLVGPSIARSDPYVASDTTRYLQQITRQAVMDVVTTGRSHRPIRQPLRHYDPERATMLLLDERLGAASPMAARYDTAVAADGQYDCELWQDAISRRLAPIRVDVLITAVGLTPDGTAVPVPGVAVTCYPVKNAPLATPFGLAFADAEGKATLFLHHQSKWQCGAFAPGFAARVRVIAAGTEQETWRVKLSPHYFASDVQTGHFEYLESYLETTNGEKPNGSQMAGVAQLSHPQIGAVQTKASMSVWGLPANGRFVARLHRDKCKRDGGATLQSPVECPVNFANNTNTCDVGTDEVELVLAGSVGDDSRVVAEASVAWSIDTSARRPLSIVLYDLDTTTPMACADLSLSLRSNSPKQNGKLGGVGDGYDAALPSLRVRKAKLLRPSLIEASLKIDVTGLRASFAHPSHVHALPCSSALGGPMYFRDAACAHGPSDECPVTPDTTWTTSMSTNPRGRLEVRSKIAHDARADALSWTVFDCLDAAGAPDATGACEGGSPRIACVDFNAPPPAAAAADDDDDDDDDDTSRRESGDNDDVAMRAADASLSIAERINHVRDLTRRWQPGADVARAIEALHTSAATAAAARV